MGKKQNSWKGSGERDKKQGGRMKEHLSRFQERYWKKDQEERLWGAEKNWK